MKDENGIPRLEECLKKDFGAYVNTKETFSLFRAIYNNQDGALDKFLAFLSHTVRRFMTNPYVALIDPFNEPTIVMDDPIMFIASSMGGDLDKNVLEIFYSKINAVLRDVAPGSIMAFEPQFDLLRINVGNS